MDWTSMPAYDWVSDGGCFPTGSLPNPPHLSQIPAWGTAGIHDFLSPFSLNTWYLHRHNKLLLCLSHPSVSSPLLAQWEQKEISSQGHSNTTSLWSELHGHFLRNDFLNLFPFAPTLVVLSMVSAESFCAWKLCLGRKLRYYNFSAGDSFWHRFVNWYSRVRLSIWLLFYLIFKTQAWTQGQTETRIDMKNRRYYI